MISKNFLKAVKKNWVRDLKKTPTGREMPDLKKAGSVEDINKMMEELNDLGEEGVAFDDLVPF